MSFQNGRGLAMHLFEDFSESFSGLEGMVREGAEGVSKVEVLLWCDTFGHLEDADNMALVVPVNRWA